MDRRMDAGRTSTLPMAAQGVYGPGATADFPGEDNVTHAGVNVATLSGVFDERLDVPTVLAIAGLFIRP